jgi:hypothetical protein
MSRHLSLLFENWCEKVSVPHDHERACFPYVSKVRTPGRVYFLQAEHNNMYHALGWVQVSVGMSGGWSWTFPLERSHEILFFEEGLLVL